MPMLSNREYRQIINDVNTSNIIVETQETQEPSYIVEGYAMNWEAYPLFTQEDGTVIYERFERSCFDKCDMSDVIMQYDHEGKVFARLSNNTLQLNIDDTGLHIRADLSKSQPSRDMYEEIRNGLVTKMSWGFATGDYYFDKATRTIVHTSIKKIYDISAVSIPANDSTSISARRSAVLDSTVEQIAKELEEEKQQQQLLQQRAKQKLQLKLKLGGF